MKIKPGDLFEWVHCYTEKSVSTDEKLFSDVMQQWIPCGGVCLCIGVNNRVIYWISVKGIYKSHGAAGSAVLSTTFISMKLKVVT